MSDLNIQLKHNQNNVEALVIFSGGQDSTTCLALARAQFNKVHALSFCYNQRHLIEIEAARKVASALAVDSHTVVDLGSIFHSDSPLVSSRPVTEYASIETLPQGVEETFVPGRNILFLTLAANRAYALGIRDIFIGVCEEDFGGYWDCRGSFIKAMESALGEGMYGEATSYNLHTPLLHLNKSAAVKLAYQSLGAEFERIFALTHTCYQGQHGGCGKCHACHLRDRGFREAGIADPLWKIRSQS